MSDEQPLISHLVELRTRLLRSLSCVFIIFALLAFWSSDIYSILATPLTDRLPEGSTMIATNVATPFFTPIKLTIVVAIFLSVPYILYQIWSFIAPALYKNEKRLVYPLLVSSTVLFYLGVAFAYYVVFPLVFGFLTSSTPEGVSMATDISSYLDFVLTLFIAFGICFEVPVAIILLCWAGVTSVEDLKAKRPYIIVIAFVIGMFLTPPDMFSQTLLAIPMIFLFEIGLICAKFYEGRGEREDAKKEKQ